MMHVNNCAFPDLASVAEKYAAYLGVTAAKITRINDTHHETEQRTNATALAEQVQMNRRFECLNFTSSSYSSISNERDRALCIYSSQLT